MNDFWDVEKQEQRLRRLIEDLSEKDRNLIYKALELAKKKHAGQERDEGGPYIIHPIRAACSLIKEAKIRKPEVICAALLHDTIEDTDLELKEIAQRFGERVGEIVFALTRVKESDETEKNRYERKHQHHVKIMQSDKEIRAAKTCDLLDNVRSWPYVSEDHFAAKRLKRWFKEGKNMYLPLAESVTLEMAEKMRKALNKAKARWKDYLDKST